MSALRIIPSHSACDQSVGREVEGEQRAVRIVPFSNASREVLKRIIGCKVKGLAVGRVFQKLFGLRRE